MAPTLQEVLCLRVTPLQSTFTALTPFEKKGFSVVGVKNHGGGALVALRGPSELMAAGRALATKVAATLPPNATLVASSSVAEALEWMHEVFRNPREIVQWTAPEESAGWLRANEDEPLRGAHNGNRESFTLAELMAPGAVGSEAGRRFCAQMRRDSYVPILLPASERALFEDVEAAAMKWFALDEDEKMAQGGAYGHVDRKFTGYRAGKFREQLEVRQTIDDAHRGGLYPWPTAPDAFGAELRRLIYFLDATARKLLRHIAVDVGADDGFFEGLLDPPPPPLSEIDASSAGAAAAATGEGEGAPPSLGHSLIRLCRYDADSEGVYGSNVLCEEHNDVGFITLDACASTAGLEAFRRADGLWVPVEEAPPHPSGQLVLLAMVGDTLGRLTANHYAPCKHRVVQPPEGCERIGLPFLFRGRSDAVLNTRPTREACAKAWRVAHLAEMETTTIKELPAFDSAKSILRGWFRSVKSD